MNQFNQTAINKRDIIKIYIKLNLKTNPPEVIVVMRNSSDLRVDVSNKRNLAKIQTLIDSNDFLVFEQ
jgi:hypothetical protein